MTSGDGTTSPALEEYLDRLSDLLPAGEARRIRSEVRTMILDRAEAERESDPELDDAAAHARALASWDPPEVLAEQLAAPSPSIDLATRRAYWRSLWALFAGHLALAIVLTAAGTETSTVPGFIGPLPTGSWIATVLGVLSLLCVDAGFLLLLFVMLGRSRAARGLPRVSLKTTWTRRGGVQGLILIVLLAVVFNLFLDSIFALKQGDRLEPFLGEELKRLLPWLNVVLGLYAVRHLLSAMGRGDGAPASAADALASLGAGALAILAATRSHLVVLPEAGLTAEARDVLEDVIERVFLLVFVVAALFLAIRFVKSSMRTARLVRG